MVSAAETVARDLIYSEHRVLEWERVVPARYFGAQRACWVTGDTKCFKADGTPFAGRECCVLVDLRFRRMEADLHNLIPAVSKATSPSNKLVNIPDEAPVHTSSGVDVGRTVRVLGEPDQTPGHVARIWLYMAETYSIKISTAERAMFEERTRAEPVDEWERLRNRRIEAVQGNSNGYVE